MKSFDLREETLYPRAELMRSDSGLYYYRAKLVAKRHATDTESATSRIVSTCNHRHAKWQDAVACGKYFLSRLKKRIQRIESLKEELE